MIKVWFLLVMLNVSDLILEITATITNHHCTQISIKLLKGRRLSLIFGRMKDL